MENLDENFFDHDEDYKSIQINNQKSNEEIVDDIEKDFNIIDKQLLFKKDQGIIVFVGLTGSGKTSIVSYLTGETLVGHLNEEGKVNLINENIDSSLHIGNSYKSMTRFANIIPHGEHMFVDCPGPLDNRSVDQEIKKLYSIH